MTYAGLLSYMSCVLHPVLPILMTLPSRFQLKLCDSLFESPGLVGPPFLQWSFVSVVVLFFPPCSSKLPVAHSFISQPIFLDWQKASGKMDLVFGLFFWFTFY